MDVRMAKYMLTSTSFILLVMYVEITNSNPVVSDLIEELLDPSRYNSRTRPSADSGQPLDIYININVNDISSISEVKMDYCMTLYLRQVWRDERLDFSKSRHNKSITLNHNQFHRLWTPDIFVRNLKAGVFHTITVPNRLIRLSPDGTVLYSQRLTLTLACDMILNKYPMDNQTCKIEFGSYAYTVEDLVFNWRTDANPVEILRSTISLPEYDITDVSHEVCTKNLSSTGNFPCLRAHIHLNRRLRAYILTTYLPSFLVVLLSWLSFWIDLESAPARTSLSILTILTITTQSSGLMRSMPAGSFTRAIDVWMATCLVFVFGAFIEYSVVNTLARRQKAKNSKHAADAKLMAPAGSGGCKCSACAQEVLSSPAKNGWNDEVLLSPTISCSHQSSHQNPDVGLPGYKRSSHPIQCKNKPPSCWSELENNRAIMVEVIARVLFPVLFIGFNLVYWPWYLM